MAFLVEDGFFPFWSTPIFEIYTFDGSHIPARTGDLLHLVLRGVVSTKKGTPSPSYSEAKRRRGEVCWSALESCIRTLEGYWCPPPGWGVDLHYSEFRTFDIPHVSGAETTYGVVGATFFLPIVFAMFVVGPFSRQTFLEGFVFSDADADDLSVCLLLDRELDREVERVRWRSLLSKNTPSIVVITLVSLSLSSPGCLVCFSFSFFALVEVEEE